MISKSKLYETGMKLLLQQQQTDIKSDYYWIERMENINFWKFLSLNFLELERFFTLLDIETGPTSGWERFVEAVGLQLWEDRKWCQQYHNGIGPTKAALIKILSKKRYDEHLSLQAVLSLLKEMERFDILRQIDWAKLAEKDNYACYNEKLAQRECSDALVLKLNCANEALVKSANLGTCDGAEWASNDGFSEASDDLKDEFKMKNPKTKSSSCVLMTYAKDAEVDAIKIAEQLKQEFPKKRKVNVLLLHSPAVKAKLLNDTANTLHAWFHQVRYIIPVVSPQYVRQIQNNEFSQTEDPEEALHNRLVYKLTLDQYVSFGARNLRCRAICPNRFQEIRSSPVVQGNGLFSIMWGSSPGKIEEFRKILMDRPILPKPFYQ